MSFSRVRPVLFAAFTVILFAMFPFLVSAHALADASASVTPGGGDMHTSFMLAAGGLQPGDAVQIVIFDAAGSRFTYQVNGVEQAIVVDSTGSASLTVTPATDTPGSQAGNWTAVFTEQETGFTATLHFDVSN